MLPNMFHTNRPSVSGEKDFLRYTIYEQGGHLGHVTWTKQTVQVQSSTIMGYSGLVANLPFLLSLVTAMINQ